MMRTIFIQGVCSLIFFLFSSYSFSQKDKLFLAFNENSPKTYLEEVELGKKVETKIYLKNIQSNGNIDFYIKGLLFIHDKSEMENKVIDCKEIKSKDLLSADDVVAHIKGIQKKYPLGYKYPSEEFPIMYIVDKIKNEIILYEVKWQYYIK